MSQPSFAAPGDQIGRRFRLGDLLGRGGFGAVFAATDQLSDGAEVALKLLDTEAEILDAAIDRFEREARAVASLRHPATVRVIDAGRDERFLWLAMERLHGETLAKRLERGRLSAVRAHEVAEAVLGSLAEAHDRGLIHRDLKPANVFVTADDQVKVLDFGCSLDLATTVSRLSGSGEVPGTPAYMAPEQIAEEPLGPQTDVYAVGLLLLAMLAGELPWSRRPDSEVLLRKVNTRGHVLADAGLERFGPLGVVITKATERRPRARYAHAGAMLQALRQTTVEPEHSASLRDGEAAFVAGDTASAAIAFNAVLDRTDEGDPKRAQAWLGLMQAALRSGEFLQSLVFAGELEAESLRLDRDQEVQRRLTVARANLSMGRLQPARSAANEAAHLARSLPDVELAKEALRILLDVSREDDDPLGESFFARKLAALETDEDAKEPGGS